MKTKFKKSGVVSDLVSGIGGLIVLVIITLVIVSTILGASLFDRSTTTVLNELDAWINETDYTLDEFSSIRDTYTLTAITNATSATAIVLANASLDSTTGVITNATALVFGNVSINYTYVEQNRHEVAPGVLAGNLTEGIDNVSEKIPTILLIAAVVLLFGVLILLIARSKQMGIGGGGSL